MAVWKPEIQYVRFYTDGSAARQPELNEQEAPRKAEKKAKKAAPRKKITIFVDPLAVTGLVLAFVMAVMMIVGAVQLYHLQSQEQMLQSKISQLEEKKIALKATYDDSYDLEQVAQAAELMGLIPRSQAQVVMIAVPEPQEVKVSMWDHVLLFLADLMA